jgi:hypothetical protein
MNLNYIKECTTIVGEHKENVIVIWDELVKRFNPKG